MGQPTTLTVHSGALARIGQPDERDYLIGIMAETLGIPARDAGRADVIALLGMAAQQTMTYGALPGIHLHVQKFESKESKNRRERSGGEPEYTYTLVQGEKLWKDSGARWRIMYGVNWTYQRKPMSREEIVEQAKLMGYFDAPPPIAYGMWSRIIMIGVDDPKDDDNPMWSSGLFLGKRKAGRDWYAEDLPTGVTSRDVAVRRADKRAMMQSSLSLLPLDSLLPAERIERLTDHLRSEGSAYRGDILMARQNYEIEEDGDILYASDPVRGAPRQLEATDDVSDDLSDDIADGLWASAEPVNPDPAPAPEKAGAWPETKADARPDADARPRANTGPDPDARPSASKSTPQSTPVDGPCPECHAPAGKPHATSCSQRSGQKDTPKSTSKKADARPSEKADAKADARPAKTKSAEGGDWAIYASVLHNAEVRIDSDLASAIMNFQDQHRQSTAPLSEAQYKLLRMLIHSVLEAQDPEHKMLLSCMCGESVDHTKRPGNQLRYLIDWFKSPNNFIEQVELAREILDLCRLVRQELVSA